MRKKIIDVIVMASMLTCILGGCGNTRESGVTEQKGETSAVGTEATNASEDKQEEILFWHSYSEGEEKVFTEQVLAAFEKAHPEIKVNVVRMPYEGMDEQLVTAVSGDAAPDVMRMDITWVPQMAKLGALEKLDDYDGFDVIKSEALENAMATNLYAGSYYGLPLNSNTTVAVFNKKLLQEYGLTEVPQTMEELLAAADKADPKVEKWLFAIQGSFNWAMLPFIWTLGGTLTDENFTMASGYLNSTETVAALETICQWYQNGIIGPCIVGEAPDTWGGMEGNNYGMIVEGPWYYSASDTAMETTIPSLIPSVDGRSISIIGGENLVMTSTSKHKEAAWTFMQFLMQDEQQIQMAKAGMIPTTLSAMEKVDVSESPYVEVYMEQLKTANPRTPSAEWSTIEDILNRAFEEVLRGAKTAQSALDDAATEIDQLLAQ